MSLQRDLFVNYKPHHGFSKKTKDLLTDNSVTPEKDLSSLSLSEIKKMISNNKKDLTRNDSTITTDSVQSTSSTKSMPNQDNFDNIILGDNDQVKPKPNLNKFLGIIGKTRSEADFFNGKPSKTVIKTFQQQNIVKLPSLENDLETQNRVNRYKEIEASLDKLVIDTMGGSRKIGYEMK
uniref:Uncharacterized protein n=1 Tax=Parastrongyloides trichosuri TaxID=131310 RepID=A0A0N4Z608_PARTI